MNEPRNVVTHTPSGLPLKHGYTGYNRYKCRCDVCTQANRERNHRNTQRRTELLQSGGAPKNLKHGTASTYGNWGCRCDPCTKAGTEKCRSYYRRVLSATARESKLADLGDDGFDAGKSGKTKKENPTDELR